MELQWTSPLPSGTHVQVRLYFDNQYSGTNTVGKRVFNVLVDGTTVHAKQTGFTYGAGLGIRLLVFTLGAHFRMGTFSDFRLWTLNLEGGMHVPQLTCPPQPSPIKPHVAPTCAHVLGVHDVPPQTPGVPPPPQV